MSRKDDVSRPARHTEDIDPAPWLGRVGAGATLPSGEYISRELRELVERERAHRAEERAEREHRDPHRTDADREEEERRRARR